MDNRIQRTPRSNTVFFVGVLWCLAVFGAYHWFNTAYYAEKLSVFFSHLKSLVG